MNLLRYAFCLMLLTAAGSVPPPTIAAEVLPAEIGQRITCTGQMIYRGGMPARAEAAHRRAFCADAGRRGGASGIEGDDGRPSLADDGGPSLAVVRAAELRIFALYGPREFSTFSEDEAGSWAAGETASGPGPFDSHAEDPWLGFDKAQHLSFSFLWTLGTQYVAVNKGHLSESRALPLSIGTSAAVGLSKELYDLHTGPTNVFSYRDLVANGVGILLATGVILL